MNAQERLNYILENIIGYTRPVIIEQISQPFLPKLDTVWVEYRLRKNGKLYRFAL